METILEGFFWDEQGQQRPLLPRYIKVRGAGNGYKIDASLWLKWLDYEPDFEKKLIQTLSSKEPSSFSLEELQILTKYQERKRISQIIKRYQTNFDWDEYNEANTYLSTNSIEKLMLDKLSQEEQECAKLEIERVSQLPYEELKKKVEEMLSANSSSNLSMVDSYILYEIADVELKRYMSRYHAQVSREINNERILSRGPQYNPLKQ